jgi:hypothetical protein
MQLEINPKFTDKQPTIHAEGVTLLLTPPIDEGYWWMRVPLSPSQAIVAFPKFGTVGIGFQQEDDWNTNLPYSCKATEIFNHISHNKGASDISDETCVRAIELIQEAIRQIREAL